tara:strand:- start:59 stop:658 length:600 start_codon:yes stop_codon:yes gene_type:complete
MDKLENYIKKYGGIQPPHLLFYCQAIRFNVESAMVSIEYLASFIEMTNETEGDYEITGDLQDGILDHLQNLLVHAGALSRYFWPSKPGKHDLHKLRAETLKLHFGVSEESPLKSRMLRNQLEHFDENLDKYLWEKPIVGHVLPAYVGGEVENDGIPAHFFRAFYIDVGVFETLGVRHEVQPIVDEVCSLYQRFHSASNT